MNNTTIRLAMAIAATLSLAAPAAAQRRVAITFDDLPMANTTASIDVRRALNRRLIDGLRASQAPAIGFVVESKLYRNGKLDPARVALLQEWSDQGFDLGNHTYSHPDMNQQSIAQFRSEVLRGERVTRQVLKRAGKTPRYFRYPALHTGNAPAKRQAFEAFLEQRGYISAPVTIDDDDYLFANAYNVVRTQGNEKRAREIGAEYVSYMNAIFAFYEKESRQLLGYEPPQVLLLHASRLNADYVRQLTAMLRRRGYQFVSLDEVMRDSTYQRADRYYGPLGLSWLYRWTKAPAENPSARADYPKVPSNVLRYWPYHR